MNENSITVAYRPGNGNGIRGTMFIVIFYQKYTVAENHWKRKSIYSRVHVIWTGRN